MYADSGSARNSTTRATSLGSPSRPAGIRATIYSIAVAGTAAVIAINLAVDITCGLLDPRTRG